MIFSSMSELSCGHLLILSLRQSVKVVFVTNVGEGWVWYSFEKWASCPLETVGITQASHLSWIGNKRHSTTLDVLGRTLSACVTQKVNAGRSNALKADESARQTAPPGDI